MFKPCACRSLIINHSSISIIVSNPGILWEKGNKDLNNFDETIWYEKIIEKLEREHNVQQYEVRESIYQ
jgi:hypothetical protein